MRFFRPLTFTSLLQLLLTSSTFLLFYSTLNWGVNVRHLRVSILLFKKKQRKIPAARKPLCVCVQKCALDRVITFYFSVVQYLVFLFFLFYLTTFYHGYIYVEKKRFFFRKQKLRIYLYLPMYIFLRQC